MSIIRTAQDREMLRAEGGQSRPSMIGGGFGVEGAVRGVAAATAVTAAVGLVYGTASAVGKAVATGGDKRKKTALFQAPTTKAILSDVLLGVALAGHRLVADIVNREREETRFEVVSDVAERRALALMANVEAGRVPTSETPDVLAEAIQLNPFSDPAWKLWIERVGDEDGSVEFAAQDFGVRGLDQHKRWLLDQRRAEWSWSTPEKCRADSGKLGIYARFYGVPFDPIKDEIEAHALALDERRRTFSGSTYATVEEKEAAQAESEAIVRRTVAGVVQESDAAAEEARDIQRRTFNGQLYVSQKEMQIAKRGYLRSQSFFCWVGVVLAPFPSSFFTLTNAFNKKQRLLAFGWMLICSGTVVYNMGLSAILMGVLGCVVFVFSLALAEVEVELKSRFGSQEISPEAVPPPELQALADLQIWGKRLF